MGVRAADRDAAEAFRIRYLAEDDGSVLVAVSGEVDVATAPRLHDVLDHLLIRQQATVLDLSEVRFMDSAGIHVLLWATHEAVRDGWSFSLTPELSGAVARTVDLTGARAVLPFQAA
jgi:anti-sigma B factor antagonist